MIQTYIRSVLATDTNVMNIVGDRIYYVQRPQKSILPAIVINQVSNVPQYNMVKATWAKARVQVNCLGTTYRQAHELASAVYAAIRDGVDDLQYNIGTGNIYDLPSFTLPGQDSPISYGAAVDVDAIYITGDTY